MHAYVTLARGRAGGARSGLGQATPRAASQGRAPRRAPCRDAWRAPPKGVGWLRLGTPCLAFTETKKHSPNTGARAHNTLHMILFSQGRAPKRAPCSDAGTLGMHHLREGGGLG